MPSLPKPNKHLKSQKQRKLKLQIGPNRMEKRETESGIGANQRADVGFRFTAIMWFAALVEALRGIK